MKVLIKITFVMLVFMLFLTFSFSSGQSAAEWIDVLCNDPNSYQRERAALQLGQLRNFETTGVLYTCVENDESYRVKNMCLNAIRGIADQHVQEICKDEKDSIAAQHKSDEVREIYWIKLRSLLENPKTFHCKNPSSVKAKIVSFFKTSDKNQDYQMLLRELHDICAASFEQRKSREEQKPYQGDELLSELIETLSAARGRSFVTDEKLRYTDNVAMKFVPLFNAELKTAQGDYKLSLLIILGKISTQKKFDTVAKKYVASLTLTQAQLSEIEGLLSVTESVFLKREGLRTLNGYHYQITSEKVKNIVKEFQEKSESGVKF